MLKPLSAVLPVALALAACGGENQDPAGADALLARVRAAGYTTWRRPAHAPSRQPSFTLHAGSVDVYLNETLARAVDDRAQIKAGEAGGQFPVGSIVVKEGYSGSSLAIVAVMERRDATKDGWYFAEYDAAGKALYSGRPAVCVGCHDARAAYSDWLYSVELPRP